jgi:hypothetical protein
MFRATNTYGRLEVNGQLLASSPYPCYPLDRKLAELLIRFGHCGKGNNPGNRAHDLTFCLHSSPLLTGVIVRRRDL